MLNFDTFLMALLVVSSLTGLVTEAVKKIIAERNDQYRSNTIAGLVSMVLSVAICAGYILLKGIAITPQVCVYLVALMFMSWLCTMVGYDKVIQTFGQFKANK